MNAKESLGEIVNGSAIKWSVPAGRQTTTWLSAIIPLVEHAARHTGDNIELGHSCASFNQMTSWSESRREWEGRGVNAIEWMDVCLQISDGERKKKKTYHAKVIIPDILDIAWIVDCVVVLHHFCGFFFSQNFLHDLCLAHSLTHTANLIDIHFAKFLQFPLLKQNGICNSFFQREHHEDELNCCCSTFFLIRVTRVNKKIWGFFPV